MQKHLVIVGGGHAHLTVLLHCGAYVRKGHRVSLVSPSPYHYYSGMGPGLLGGTYRVEETRFHIRKMAEDRGAAYIEDAVERIEPSGRTLALRSGARMSYDVASFNIGSDVSLLPGASNHGAVFPVKPIASLVSASEAIRAAAERGKAHIAVAGGGPAGVEIAGNAWRFCRELGVDATITLFAGGGLLTGLPPRVRGSVLRSFQRRAIMVREGAYVRSLAPREAVLDSGERVPAEVALIATGIAPSPLFRESGLPVGPDGGLLVNGSLQSPAHPEIFGGGDCISFGPRLLAKVGVHAVRQNAVLFRNLFAMLEGGGLEPFSPQRDFLLILNLGDGTGVATKHGCTWHGRLAFLLKDRIDRMFMRKFQVSNEREEHTGKDSAPA